MNQEVQDNDKNTDVHTLSGTMVLHTAATIQQQSFQDGQIQVPRQ